ncbi:Uncharacterized protein involved in outer membrane biogenesis [Paracidovorax konjaci]|uniref:Uncharacterized protein involved in outer membrane biogenesis n=2 Tax=Paracidovorax konjaci TaxID=32040 RepID=A0A1I1T9E0_9BURK|nr:Uncharacterized protein involved in outer membrane biogenesis [Paracidovorax konjaci]
MRNISSQIKKWVAAALPRQGRARFGNPWLRWLARGVALVLLAWAVAWLTVPTLVRMGIEHWSLSQWGRSVQVGRVEFKPWTLELAVNDLSVAAALPEAPPLLEIRRIYIDMELQSLVRLGPVLDAVEVDAPRLRITREEGGRYDIDDLLQRWAGRSVPQDKDAGSSGARFALYNLVLRNGAVDFSDRATGQSHTLDALELGIPFLSNLPADREVTVTPRLAFTLNGSAFDSGAQATPFAADRHTRAQLRIQGLDLSPLHAYWPSGVPLRLRTGRLDAALEFDFMQAEDKPSLTVTGNARLADVQMEGPPGAAPVAFDALEVRAASVRPLQRVVHLSSVEWAAPRLEVRRDAQGRLVWPGASRDGAATQPAEPPASTQPWQVMIDRVTVQKGRIAWRDEAAMHPVALEWNDVLAQASSVAWPWAGGVPFALQARMARQDAVPSAVGRGPTLRAAGTAWPDRGQVAASVRGVPLSAFGAYAAAALAPQVDAVLDADAGFAWNQRTGATVAKVAHLSADGVAVACPSPERCAAPKAAGGTNPEAMPASAWAQAQRLQIEDAWIDLTARSVSVARLAAQAPRLRAERSADGRWMFDRWVASSFGSADPPTGAGGRESGAPWTVRLADVSVNDGALAFRDAVPAVPVELQMSAIAVHARQLAFPPVPSGKQPFPMPLTVSAQVGAGRREPGRLAYDGTLSMAPFSVQGRLTAQRLPLHALEPYVAPWLNVHVVRAEAGFEGDVQYADAAAGATASVRGNAALDEVRVRAASVPALGAESSAVVERGEELLRWRNLAFQGVQVDMAPGRPVSVDVRETALRDFFARIVLQKSGRLNLQDLIRDRGEPSAAATPSAEPPRPAAVVRFGPVAVSAGAVRFTDYFIEPNYSADLSELAGRLSAFSSEPIPGGTAPEMAELELKGRVQGTASLDISGRLNPLAKPLALDVQGRVRDLELPPLSPYAVKYAGHGIERGKLSMDVGYKVLPGGQLTATNRLVLNQLAFGEPVQGAPASLPVRLAVALLADSNGVIDLDLPISGSLNDPQFSLGPVILRAIGSMVLKAVASPFSLLANAFGGSSAEQGTVAFAPGSALLDSAAREGLGKVARTLRDRPTLQLTVTGHAYAEGEEDGWKRERLAAQVALLQQRRQASSAAPSGALPSARSAASDPLPYPEALKELYRRSDIAKPRNLLGLPRDLPVPEMEALLLSQMKVPAAAARDLAQARAVAVRDHLAGLGLPMERLFVGAPRVDTARGETAPQAELTLSTR